MQNIIEKELNKTLTISKILNYSYKKEIITNKIYYSFINNNKDLNILLIIDEHKISVHLIKSMNIIYSEYEDIQNYKIIFNILIALF